MYPQRKGDSEMGRQQRDCCNSPRHVSKTHGSHNGRWYSWPHVSDALDRPPSLEPPTVATVGKKHAKARHPLRSSNVGKQPGQGRWQSDMPVLFRYHVTGTCAHDGSPLIVIVNAQNIEEAASIGRDLLAIESMSSVCNVRTVREGDTTPRATSTPHDPNPWRVNK